MWFMGSLASVCPQDVSELSPVEMASQGADFRSVSTWVLLVPAQAQNDTVGEGMGKTDQMQYI